MADLRSDSEVVDMSLLLKMKIIEGLFIFCSAFSMRVLMNSLSIWSVESITARIKRALRIVSIDRCMPICSIVSSVERMPAVSINRNR